MSRKNILLYALIAALLILFIWQWAGKGSLISQLNEMQRQNGQLFLLAGIGPLKSAHLHADVKVYINNNQIDFSQRKYQITTSFIHFEDGIGDVIHTHAAGLTVGHMFKSVGMNLNYNCLTVGSESYCNGGNKKLGFYVNGKLNNDFDNHVIQDLDKYLISYGEETQEELQKQLNSITNLAPKYSASK